MGDDPRIIDDDKVMGSNRQLAEGLSWGDSTMAREPSRCCVSGHTRWFAEARYRLGVVPSRRHPAEIRRAPSASGTPYNKMSGSDQGLADRWKMGWGGSRLHEPGRNPVQ